jgi:hypothetical protein
VAAPDYAAPIVGWRGWLVVEAGGALRLCSIVYHTPWPPRQELVASCRGGEHRLSPELPAEHSAPEAACRCGIYACESAAAATPFLAGARRPARQTLGFVLGRVSLWGKVVECQRGWRGERAYPASIYVPRLSAKGRLLLARRPGPEAVALALGSYGVRVESVACESVTELARVLAGERVQA